jgi:hypothetical protein
MQIGEGIELNPDYERGGWLVRYNGQDIQFQKLNEAVETVIELSVVIGIENAVAGKQIHESCLMVQDVVEAMRNTLVTWYQLQVPDPHEGSDLNVI